MALGSDKTWDEWIEEYSQSHQHPINRACHAVGIPMIVLSIALLILTLRFGILWRYAIIFFVVGWVFQFIGHFYEKKPPEFFKDWRFLLVGTRWWVQKILRGK